jgi:hypothetical protein
VKPCRTVLAVAVLISVASCSSGNAKPGSSAAEKDALKADQALRDATIAVRAMRPADRKLEPVFALLGTAELRASASSEFAGTWADSYDERSTIIVERQRTAVLPSGEVTVHTCERDRANPIKPGGSPAAAEGKGVLDASAKTFRKRGDGVWIYTAYAADDRICQGIRQ